MNCDVQFYSTLQWTSYSNWRFPYFFFQLCNVSYFIALLCLFVNQNHIFHLIILTLSLKFQECFAKLFLCLCMSMYVVMLLYKWENIINIKNNFKAFLWFLLWWKYCLLMNPNEIVLYIECEKLPRGVNQLLWQKAWVWKSHFSHEKCVWKSRMKKSLGEKLILISFHACTRTV